MDPVAAVMLDVARIVTFQAKVTNTENRRTARERELRSTEAAIADEPATAAADMTQRVSLGSGSRSCLADDGETPS